MTNPTIDFGNLDYRPRLEKVLTHAIDKFRDNGYDCDIDDVDESRYYINSNCFFILIRDEDDEGEQTDTFQISLNHDLGIHPSNFMSPQYVLKKFEFGVDMCDDAEDRHAMVQTVVNTVIHTLSCISVMSGSIRNVKMCFCRKYLAPLGQDMCGLCERQSSLYDKEPCPICLEAQQVEAPWIEVPCCKKVFHQWCISRCNVSCPTCRGDKYPHKLL